MSPLVSVVIPTRNRSQLVHRSVLSALSQTLLDIEVIVVIDGPDSATAQILAEVQDLRVRVIELPISQGGAAARNTGVTAAQGEWVAFLDDDDEWFPTKLERQMELARQSTHAFPIVACRLIARTPTHDLIWPRRLPNADEPLSEYLLARKTLVQGEGLLQTSTLLAKRELLIQAPFRSLKKHQEWDWLLHANALEGVGIDVVPDPLVVWYIEENRKSVGNSSSWHYSLAWIQEIRQLVTPKAYAAFLMTIVSAFAAKDGEWQAAGPLLWQAFRFGRPRLIDFYLFAGMWLIPQSLRRRLRSLLPKAVKA
jgi:glycosyltransferase involved in cell wall biosynthesis